MGWKCPRCGFEDNSESSRNCSGGCGYVRIPRTVTLTSAATGQRISISVDTVVGKYLLKTFAGDEHIYASEPQFKIVKDAALGCWAIEHLESAKNPTFCNGSSLAAGPTALPDGCIISLGPERMKLTVSLVE